MAELVPDGAWETHIHVFDPNKFPYAPKRSYTPQEASLSEYPSDLTGCKNIVIVHASMQGSSPEPLLDTLRGQDDSKQGSMLRGLATIDPSETSAAELDRLHQRGVRGIRLHRMAWGHGAQSEGNDIVKDIQTIAEKTAHLHWLIDIFCPIAAWAAMADEIRRLDPRVSVIADHFGGAFPGDEDSENFQIFLQLVREGRLYVKLSGFERLYHGHDRRMEAIKPLAMAIIEAGPNQILYGSDWPHTQLGESRKGKSDEQRLKDVEGFRDVPDAEHIRTLRGWIRDDSVWEKLFVKNADRLFG